jgi:hypothetical protein
MFPTYGVIGLSGKLQLVLASMNIFDSEFQHLTTLGDVRL